MKQKLVIFSLAVAGLALLAGCGSGGGIAPGADKDTLLESEKCIGCHDGTDSNHSNWNTPGTGKPIVTEWKASTHNSGTNGASCQDCHGSGYMHPVSCNKCHAVGGAGSNPLLNPDDSDRCATCHAKVNPRPGKFDGFNAFTYEDPNIPKIPNGSTTRFIHFSTGKRANFVSTNYIRNCRKCHNPHDTSSGKQQRLDWAQSGHGATTTNPRTNSDFKFSGSSLDYSLNYGNICVRCHTSTGPIKFITSGFVDVKPLSLPATDKSREVTACDVCHDDGSGRAYGYKVRNVPQLTNYYNYSAGLSSAAVAAGATSHISIPKQFPNIAESNVCLVCHVGREIGETIKQASLQNIDFKNVTFMSSHYLTAGASLFQISGYNFAGRDYATQGTYPYPHLHRQIGRDNYNGTGSNGPCVTCHLKPARHTFLPVTLGSDAVLWKRPVTNIISPECAKCHGSNPAEATGLPPLAVTGSSSASAINLNLSKAGFFAALEVLRIRMATLGMYYGRGGIKTTSSLTTNVTNWEASPKFGNGTGPNTMGAAFNYVLLNFDYGAYAHNSAYAKRLLYDSIDHLDDGVLNYSTCTYLFAQSDTTAYNYICKNVITGLAGLNTSGERP